MQAVRLKRPILVFLFTATLLCGRSVFCAESDLENTTEAQNDSTQQDESISPAPLHGLRLRRSLPRAEELFQDDSDSTFSRTNAPRKIRSGNGNKRIFSLKLINHESTIDPALDEDDIPPADTRVRRVSTMDEQPMLLAPASERFDPNYCDSCDPALGGFSKDCSCQDVSNWSPIARFFGIDTAHDPNATCDLGIGHERVMFAPFEIDTTQPSNFMLVRYDSGFGLKTPDRAEYFWSMPGKGPSSSGPPASLNSINYQDLRFISEVGSDSLGVQTEIPVRFIEPAFGDATSGMGDMKVATKARLLNGKKWQITQIFRTYIPTGSAAKGVGTGHVSLEPGILARYEISPSTYVHGQVKYWIPIAGDPAFAGDVLNYGVGVSHVLYETNNFAVIPDLEMVNYNFLMGSKTIGGLNVNSSGEVAYNIIPGARIVFGPKGDLGLFELGISNMIGIGTNRYVNDMLRVDFKFIY